MSPLADLRILSFEQYGAGPFGTQYLADLGAEVIKVEPAGTAGDYARALGPFYISDEHTDSASSLFFQSLNRNKKSITLDILSDSGRKVLHRLLESADAVADNLRGDVPERLGLTYNDLKVANPAIVCAHCSAYGREGPRKSWPGYDYLMQAEAGYFHLCGEPDSEPTRFGLSLVDYMGGQSLALALLSGVLSANKSGIGRDMDVNLFDTALFNLSYLGAWALNTDFEPQRVARSGHPSLVPCQLYKTADGWIYLMCNKESFWPLLCEFLGHAELAADSRFINFDARLQHRETLTDILDSILSEKTTADWLSLFDGRLPAAPILTPKEALNNPFLEGRGRLQELTHQDGHRFRVMSSTIEGGQDRESDVGAPLLGEHTQAILEDVGYTATQIESLREEGTV